MKVTSLTWETEKMKHRHHIRGQSREEFALTAQAGPAHSVWGSLAKQSLLDLAARYPAGTLHGVCGGGHLSFLQ
jgi:hypothetical protein